MACGLSVYRDPSHAQKKLKRLKRRYRRSFAGAYVARGNLLNEHGRIRQTSKDERHFTWWFPAELTPAQRAALFRYFADV